MSAIVASTANPISLEDREARIAAVERDAYLVRGLELAAIRDGKLYRERWQTFEQYCEDRWEMTSRRAEQLMEAARFAEKANYSSLPLPARETHIRPLLARLDSDDDRLAVWRQVIDAAGGKPRKVKAADVDNAIERFAAARSKKYLTLDEWHGLHPDLQLPGGCLDLGAGTEGLNRQDNTDIEWAAWSWNPVTGCLHGCPYCYARDIAGNVYPAEVGFGPTIWPTRLDAPRDRYPQGEGAAKNIFVCSMADLFGRWVPDRWIERVLLTVENSPQWNFLFLTKFPKRMAEFAIPANAWMGTTVDVQARVANAERAFAKIEASVRWLSIEPMLEPLRFDRLDLFDWIVIGGASPSKAVDGSPATPAWQVPIDWLADLHSSARDARCKVYYKTNSGLIGELTRMREFPGSAQVEIRAPAVFDYLRTIPKSEQIG
jgi:protein gp37